MIAAELYTDVELITPPLIEPIDVDQFKKHIKFTPSSEDSLIDTYIAMARAQFEEYTGRQLITATWEYQLEGFPAGVFDLPKPPLIKVVSVTYGADDVVLVEGTDYRVTTPKGPYARRGYLQPISGAWPSATTDRAAVRIRFEAGYGPAPGYVPELARGCLFFLAAHFHQYRTEIVVDPIRVGTLIPLPIGAESIMRAFKNSALSSYPHPRRVTA